MKLRTKIFIDVTPLFCYLIQEWLNAYDDKMQISDIVRK